MSLSLHRSTTKLRCLRPGGPPNSGGGGDEPRQNVVGRDSIEAAADPRIIPKVVEPIKVFGRSAKNHPNSITTRDPLELESPFQRPIYPRKDIVFISGTAETSLLQHSISSGPGLVSHTKAMMTPPTRPRLRRTVSARMRAPNRLLAASILRPKRQPGIHMLFFDDII